MNKTCGKDKKHSGAAKGSSLRISRKRYDVYAHNVIEEIFFEWDGRSSGLERSISCLPEPVELDKVLGELMKTVADEDNISFMRLAERWPYIAGDHARHLSPVKLSGGVLYLKASNSMVLNEMSMPFKRKKMCEKINREAGSNFCSEIRILPPG